MKLRKGALKGSGKKGYYNFYPQDPKVHEQSGKGMKQPQRIPLGAQGNALPAIRKGWKLAKAQPEPKYTAEAQEIIDRFDEETFKKFLEETGISADDITRVREGDYNDLEIEIGNDPSYRIYRIFESEEDAEHMAEDRVREDLENEPEMFNQDWLENHIDKDNLRDQLESDVTDSNLSYFEDIQNENDKRYQNRGVAELIELGELDESDVENEDGTLKEEDEIKTLVDEAVEKAVEKRTEEDLQDPIEYLEGIYGKSDAMKEAIRIGGIDIEEALKDAIATDGWQHFLSSYDGNSTDLPNGRVMIRVN